MTASGAGAIRLTFKSVGTDGDNAPAARNYLIRQSTRPIRTAQDFERAPALCRGACSFKITAVGGNLMLRITALQRKRRYYYAIAARDNVVLSRRGPRSATVTARAG